MSLTNRDEIIGKTDYDLLSKEEADKIFAIDQSVITIGVHKGEECVALANEEKVFRSTKFQLKDDFGHVIGIFGTSIDVTDMKRKPELKSIHNEKAKV